MGWSVGHDNNWNRDIGYGVPSICDYPDCSKEIDRGLSYVCGGEPYGGDEGCGLYFCGDHLLFTFDGKSLSKQRCDRCCANQEPYNPKPDTLEWIGWKLNDLSWQQWRDEHPQEVEQMRIQARQ